MDSNSEVTVLCSTHCIPADGQSCVEVELRYEGAFSGTVNVCLRGRGSLDPRAHVRRQTVSINAGVGKLAVYAPRFPGFTTIAGPGFRQRVQFKPANIWHGLVYEWMPTIALAVLLALAIRTYAFAGYYIPSASMETTLMIGDVFVAESFTYRVMREQPRRGEIVLFRDPEGQAYGPLIKRVIGLPGETVLIQDGVVYVDGTALVEPYLPERSWGDFGPATIPAEHYFLMGDNRNHSHDSRAWGFVSHSNLLGRAVVVVWPLSRATTLAGSVYNAQ